MENCGLPLVSIILPTYNRAACIAETVESVRAQSFENWELLVIDDGSEDKTQEIIGKIGDGRIYFHEAGRLGIGGRIKNKGMGLARGRYIAFIDSDDLWRADKLEKQLKAMEEFPEAGFSMTGGYNFEKEGQAIDHFYRRETGRYFGSVFTALFKSEIAAFAQVLLMKKECLEQCGYFPEEKSFSDVDFIISLAMHFKAVILYEPMVFRRIHRGNYIHGNWVKSIYEGIAIIERYQGSGLLPSAIARKALYRAYLNFGESCRRFNLVNDAFRHYIKAWTYRPLSLMPARKIGRLLWSLV